MNNDPLLHVVQSEGSVATKAGSASVTFAVPPTDDLRNPVITNLEIQPVFPAVGSPNHGGALQCNTESRLADGQVVERDYLRLTGTDAKHLWIYRDVSESRHERERLRLMEAVALYAKDVILITEADPIDFPGPRVVYVNPAFTDMTGYTPDEIIGRTPRLLQGPGTNRATLRFIREKLAAWEPFTADLQNYRKDGTHFWVELSVQPVATEISVYTYWIAIQRDITQRKEVEERLAFQARSLAQVSDAVISFDDETQVLYFNAAAERLFGEPAASMMGTTLLSRRAFDWLRHTETKHSLWNQLEESDSWRDEIVVVLASDRRVILETHVSRLFDADANPMGFLAVLRDITERKRAEQERQDLYDQQRDFVKEVLRSVTGRKLELCDAPSELPGQLRQMQEIVVQSSADISVVRRATERLAILLSFSAERTGDLVCATGEAVMNAVVHAQGGTVQLCADESSGTIQIWIRDRGKGIAPEYLHRATLETGFTTGNSLGYGFNMILGTVDKLYLLTGAQGTVVVIVQERSAPDPLTSTNRYHL